MKKNENAITLIALVLTIIVLLILAEVTIETLSGENGLLTRAKMAKEQSVNSQIEENTTLDNYAEAVEKIVGSRDTSDENNYSKNEQVIGKWVDGKNIYRRYIEKSFDLKATTWKVLENTTDYNIQNIINCSIRRSTNGVLYPLCQDVNGSISIYYPVPVYDCTGYILEYTKTTDTTISD